jgi:glycosyltransferase involved in cell wall biosynthesis
MKIAVISTSAIESPPRGNRYAGIEVVTWNFARVASMRGNEVILVTTNDSEKIGTFDVLKEGTDEKLGTLSVQGVGPTGWKVEDETNMYNNYKAWLEREFGEGQGIVFDNSWWGYPYLSARKFPKMKVVKTHHGETNWMVNTPQGPRALKPPVPFPRMLGISSIHAQHLANKFACPLRYVHNGLDMPEWDVKSAQSEDWLLSLNRITPEKGIVNNIDVALQTGMKMKIVGDDIHPTSQAYIDDVQNRCAASAGQVEYWGTVDNDTKWDLLRRCKAVISCSDNSNWIEAFGNFVVEANSVGKPVLGTANGGLYDTIRNGENGFIAPTTAQIIDYIKAGNLEKFDPLKCRERAQLFTTDRMVSSYLELFEKVLREDPDSFW